MNGDDMPISKKRMEAQEQQSAPTTSEDTKRLTPYWVSECGRAVVYVGDNLAIMAQMEEEQFHAVCTDPPYGLEFMGKEWDAPWKNDGKIEVCDEGTDKSHPERDGTQRVVYGNNKVHAKQRRADEMNDPSKAPYLRYNVEYVRDSHLYQQWFRDRAEAILRVAKPGAHLLSFGGTRMWHRMVCAVEDAGWEIRDQIMWLYGSGFPKSHNISKAIDKMYGAERGVVGTAADMSRDGANRKTDGSHQRPHEQQGGHGYNDRWSTKVTEPATDDAKLWDGWGTSLKPAHEPIIVARKPPNGSVARNVLEHGCGGLNIDGCRVGSDGGSKHEPGTGGFDVGTVSALGGHLNSCRSPQREGLGRWPANVVLTHHPECRLVGKRASGDVAVHTVSTGEVVSENVAMSAPNYGRTVVGTSARPDEEVWDCHPECLCRILDEQSGVNASRRSFIPDQLPSAIDGGGQGLQFKARIRGHDDRGGASRFFYTAKADADDRPHGKGATSHPTVKPLDLMRHLVRLVAAPGSKVLDPFMGSGSTGVAALAEGCYFVGIEQSQEYADIAVGRLRLALQTAPPTPWLKTRGGQVCARSETDTTPPPTLLDD